MSSSAVNVGPIESNGQKKRPYEGASNYRFKKKQKKREKGTSDLGTDGTHEEVLLADVRELLRKHSIKDSSSNEPTTDNGTSSPATKPQLPDLQSELNLHIAELSSTGDGLAIYPESDQVYVVPFAVPGDIVKAKVFKHFPDQRYSMTDYISVITPSKQRDESLVKCPYFSKCAGCQFQMLSYQDQLAHKKTIVEKAYKNFSGLSPNDIPPVGDTIGSPLQYGYRTKLTPHFDAPPGSKQSDKRNKIKRNYEEVPPIGFMLKGTRQTIDIEDCPIGTDAVRMGMKRERKRVAEELDKYHRGATLLLRESTTRISKSSKSEDGTPEGASAPEDTIIEDRGPHLHYKTCVTDANATTTEYIDDYLFENPAGAFFQNNNSILPTFTDYIRTRILPKAPPPDAPKITNLIDAYSGSGLFTITMSTHFTHTLGIDISPSSIQSATKNAELNSLSKDQTSFQAGDASNLFASLPLHFTASTTAVVIDPPRKGCDGNFLRQLIRYSPERICYVSCNVHTQARDIGFLVRGMDGVDGGNGPGVGVYEIESLVGFDFFPQTGHVEGVAVLRKKSKTTEEASSS